MPPKFVPVQFWYGLIAVVLLLASWLFHVQAQEVWLDPAKMPRIGTVDERFASYNIEMAEVTGGNFWKPYHSQSSAAAPSAQSAPSASTPAGMNPDMYQYRPPIDLSNPRLRKLAAALGPAYVRVSGTWANTVYFADSDNPPASAPPGFGGVLTRKEWKGMIDFVHAVDGELVTSFATSVGTHDARGVWTPKQASDWLAYTKSIGGQMAATEFMNKPTYAATELYAVAALLGAIVVVLGRMLHLPTSVAATTGASLCFGLRFIAMRRGWQLPIARPSNRDS